MMKNKKEVEKWYTDTDELHNNTWWDNFVNQIKYEEKMKENGIINPNDDIVDAVVCGLNTLTSDSVDSLDDLLEANRKTIIDSLSIPSTFFDGIDSTGVANIHIPSSILQPSVPPINSVYIPSRHQKTFGAVTSVSVNGSYTKFPQTYIKTYEGVYLYKGFIMDPNGNGSNNIICKLNDDIDIEIPNEDIILRSNDLWDMCNGFIIIEKDPNGMISIYDRFHKSERHAFIRNFGDLLLVGNKNIRAFGLYRKDFSQWGWNEDDVIAELDYNFPIDENSLYLTDYDDTKW